MRASINAPKAPSQAAMERLLSQPTLNIAVLQLTEDSSSQRMQIISQSVEDCPLLPNVRRQKDTVASSAVSHPRADTVKSNHAFVH